MFSSALYVTPVSGARHRRFQFMHPEETSSRTLHNSVEKIYKTNREISIQILVFVFFFFLFVCCCCLFVFVFFSHIKDIFAVQTASKSLKCLFYCRFCFIFPLFQENSLFVSFCVPLLKCINYIVNDCKILWVRVVVSNLCIK